MSNVVSNEVVSNEVTTNEVATVNFELTGRKRNGVVSNETFMTQFALGANNAKIYVDNSIPFINHILINCDEKTRNDLILELKPILETVLKIDKTEAQNALSKIDEYIASSDSTDLRIRMLKIEIRNAVESIDIETCLKATQELMQLSGDKMLKIEISKMQTIIDVADDITDANNIWKNQMSK